MPQKLKRIQKYNYFSMQTVEKFIPDVVFYHGQCNDGFGAAFVVCQYLQDQGLKIPKLCPIWYNSSLENITKNVKDG